MKKEDWSNDPSEREESISANMLQALIGIGKSLSAEKDHDTLLRRILMLSAEITGADGGVIAMVEENESGGSSLIYKHTYALSDKEIPRIENIPVNMASIIGYVALSGEALFVDDVYELDDSTPYNFNDDFDKTYGYRTKSVLAVPMTNHADEIIGVIQMLHCKEITEWINQENKTDELPPFDKRYMSLLQSVAAQAAIALENNRMVEKINTTLEEVETLRDRLQAENVYLQQEIKLANNFEEIISANKEFNKTLALVESVSGSDSTVLILGETGTGKELIARAVHSTSSRKNHPLVKVNCAALPTNLIESELFGHEKGSFTGALSRRIGRFELADKGTIFLDEIAELPPELQAKLLRVLQEGEFERVGSAQTEKVDVRVIAATNRNLEELMENGAFREDLFYRLNVFPILCPPLRHRKEDIPPLVRHFVKKYGAKAGKDIRSIPAKAMDALQEYHWPGNVRELENIIERSMIISQRNALELGDWFQKPVAPPANVGTATTLDEKQREHILEVLEHTHWKVRGAGGAASLLGINPSTLESRMKKLRIIRQE
jgi:formate hydrogenlyase transcriptional activator